jgi:RNA polymerase sigma factor (TIGR02999 family)
VAGTLASDPTHEGAPVADRAAMDALLPLVYRELRRLARIHRRRGSASETLCTTALVHETWIKLAGAGSGPFTDRYHFFAVASRAMRQIVVDHARRRMAVKRGGDTPPISLEELDGALADPESQARAVIALDRALDGLARIDPRLVRVVELRFFAGIPVEDTADVLQVSTATIKRDTRVARAFLAREFGGTNAH